MIIGLHGKIQAGKTTAFEALQEEFKAKEFRFADGIKEMIASLLGCSVKALDNQVFKSRQIPWLKEGITPRVLMQTLGTEWGRNLIDEDIWVKSTLQKIEDYQKAGGGMAVITDVRFPNEFKALDERKDAFLIKIDRPGVDRSDPIHQHISETALDHLPSEAFDGYVVNNCDIEEFKRRIIFLV